MADHDCVLDSTKVLSALSALASFGAKRDKAGSNDAKLPLFGASSDVVHLTFILKRVPQSSNELAIVEFPLKHHCVDASTTSVCLFVKDVTKDKRSPDVDKDARDFKQVLRERGVKGINEVISYSQLRREYKTYEAKRRLASAYDIFLCDDRIVPRINRSLGKAFFNRKKIPFKIRLTQSGDIDAQIEKVLKTTRCFLRNSSSRCSLPIGALNQPTEELAESIATVWSALDSKLPGGRLNVRSLYLSANKSPELPIYVSLTSANLVRLPAPMKKAIKPVYGELTTISDDEEEEEAKPTKVKVFANGKVVVMNARGEEAKEAKTTTRKRSSKRLSKRARAKKRKVAVTVAVKAEVPK